MRRTCRGRSTLRRPRVQSKAGAVGTPQSRRCRAGWTGVLAPRRVDHCVCYARTPVPLTQGSYYFMTTLSALPDYDAPQVAINDIGSEEDFLAAIDSTIKYFNDGDIVEGTIVKVDRDEVLLDIGYKTEGVIPSRELSIKHDVDPNEVV